MKYKRIIFDALYIFGVLGILLVIIDDNNYNFENVKNILLSVSFGFVILLFSILSRESIGKGDSFFFSIAGLYISLEDNVLLFISGLFVALIYGLFIGIKDKKIEYSLYNMDIPFLPCLMPMIIWRLICM